MISNEIENSPIISIVIPTYNRAYTIKDTIQSCLEQNFNDFEILVCDDSSTDNTYSVIKELEQKDSRIHYVKNTNGKGAQFARECGINNSKGQFIVFLDSDDLLTNNSLENRYTFFLQMSEVDMVYGDVICETIDGNGNIISSSLVYYDNLNDLSLEKQKEYLLKELSLCSFGTIMVRKKSLQEKKIILNKRLKAWQDDDLVLSLVFKDCVIKHCGKPVEIMRFNGDNISCSYSNKLQGLSEILNIYKQKIISVLGYKYWILWKGRQLLDYLFVKEQYYHNKKRVVSYIFRILGKLVNRVICKFFRHIYG